VDFHVPSRAALSLAAELAKPLAASVDVLHVIDLPVSRPLGSEAYVPLPGEYRHEVERVTKERLRDWLATTEAPARSVVKIVEGKPAAEIVQYADEERVDLIVMGTDGDGGLSRLLTGSVAERVIRTAHCPVVTVRGPERAA
jgi:nucleotide-binding universal stress UspA family protein